MHNNNQTNNYKNNKVRVCGFAVVTNIVLFVLVGIVFVLPWFWGTNGYPIGLFVTSLTVLIIVFLMLIYSFITMWAVVIIDERGMHKSLFGVIFKKTILWSEIKCISNIRTLGSYAMWTVFSKSDISGMGIGRCRLRRDNIYFMFSNKLQNLVKQFYGKELSHNTSTEYMGEKIDINRDGGVC